MMIDKFSNTFYSRNKVPPEKLIISDENGAHMSQYTFGPYMEGSSVNISCTSIGGTRNGI